MSGAFIGQKVKFPELELWMVMNHCMSAGNPSRSSGRVTSALTTEQLSSVQRICIAHSDPELAM